MNRFIAKYVENGIHKSVHFDKTVFDKEKAEAWLKSKGIQNFFFFFEPKEPVMISETKALLSGDIGFDITFSNVAKFINNGVEIILDTMGGDSWEALKIHDHIKALGTNPSIGVMGSCMSAGMQILLSTENRWMTENSRGLIHNPWAVVAGDDAAMELGAVRLEKEKLQIANIYSKVSGKPLNEILELMKKEIALNATEMLGLKFVNAVKGDSFNNLVTNQNDETMNAEHQKKLGTIETLVNNLYKKLFPPKNILLQDVNGVELDFGSTIETPEQIQVGTTATVGGQPAQGEYTMPDGVVYVFEAGAITEIKPAMAIDETAQLSTEIVDLKNKLQNANTEITSLRSENATIKNEFVKIQSAFNSFKNEFSTEAPDHNPLVEGGQPVKKFTYKKK